MVAFEEKGVGKDEEGACAGGREVSSGEWRDRVGEEGMVVGKVHLVKGMLKKGKRRQRCRLVGRRSKKRK